MSFPASIPAAFVETTIAFLLPWLLPATAGDIPTARADAITLLAEAQARTARELRLAAEVIVHSFKAMALANGAPTPGLPPDTADPPLKATVNLARHSHLAQRRLDELQRRATRADQQPAARADQPPARCAAHPPATHAERQAEAVAPERAGVPDHPPHASPEASPPPAPQAGTAAAPPVQSAAQPAAPPPPADPQAHPEPTQAETKYAVALQQLTLMKARWKGAPQPHTKAGQDIQRQQRLVDAARLALAQARQRLPQATPAPAHA